MNIVTARSRATVQAVQVTEDNMVAVAAWVHGRVQPRVDWVGDGFKGEWVARTGESEVVFNEGYVTTRAVVGEWVGDSGKHYPWRMTNSTFRENYKVVGEGDNE